MTEQDKAPPAQPDLETRAPKLDDLLDQFRAAIPYGRVGKTPMDLARAAIHDLLQEEFGRAYLRFEPDAARAAIIDRDAKREAQREQAVAKSERFAVVLRAERTRADELKAERDAAIAERDEWIEKYETVINIDHRASSLIKELEAERDQAIAERDKARALRNAAIARLEQLERVEAQRDMACSKVANITKNIVNAEAERDAAIAERDEARQATAFRTALVKATTELARVEIERDSWRDAAMADEPNDEALRLVIAERDAAIARAERAEAAADVSRAEYSLMQAESAQQQAQAVPKLPRAMGQNAEGGWTLPVSLITQVENDARRMSGYDPGSLETTEAIMLLTEALLAAAPVPPSTGESHE